MDEIRIKKLIHRANYRGFKEVDLILGGFAKTHACDFSASEIQQFEALLTEKDHDVYDWITGTQSLPKHHDTPLFARLIRFRPALS